MPVPTKDDFLKMAANAKERWNFPNAIAAIDGKHVQIKAPPDSGTMYFNYLHYFSIVLQGVADSDCKFIFIDVDGYGKQSDVGTFAESQTFQFLENYEKNLPTPCSFEGSDGPMQFIFVGDDAYPLKPYLLKPYSGVNLTPEQKVIYAIIDDCNKDNTSDF